MTCTRQNLEVNTGNPVISSAREACASSTVIVSYVDPG
jgi:hypothetical protein